jgi:hypothetical protein
MVYGSWFLVLCSVFSVQSINHVTVSLSNCNQSCHSELVELQSINQSPSAPLAPQRGERPVRIKAKIRENLQNLHHLCCACRSICFPLRSPVFLHLTFDIILHTSDIKLFALCPSLCFNQSIFLPPCGATGFLFQWVGITCAVIHSEYFFYQYSAATRLPIGQNQSTNTTSVFCLCPSPFDIIHHTSYI